MQVAALVLLKLPQELVDLVVVGTAQFMLVETFRLQEL
jgi:hypothetical protein